MKIGLKILELRKKCGLTQEALSEKMDVTRQTISSWESELTSPDLGEAVKLSKIFKVSLDDLVDEEVSIDCKSPTDPFLSSLIGKEVFLDMDCDDYRINFATRCKILSVDDNFVKFEFKSGKKTVVKMVDLDLVYSFKMVETKVKK